MSMVRPVPVWQRIIAAILAIGAGLACANRIFSAEAITWFDGVFTIVVLYGVYLFGRIALLGKLPAAFQKQGGHSPRNDA